MLECICISIGVVITGYCVMEGEVARQGGPQYYTPPAGPINQANIIALIGVGVVVCGITLTNLPRHYNLTKWDFVIQSKK